jgi:predicted lipoprotein with Yx(FWY)xxD motif
MRHPKVIIASVGLAMAAAIGGVTATVASGSPASSAAPASTAPASSAGPAGSSPVTGSAAVRTAQALVGGKTETILVDSRGLPLYFYRPDTATQSFVSGQLAAAWPPLTAATPTAAGLGGKLTVVNDAHGGQVAYHGHLLYTFVSDRPGQVTGQGVQDFFVATPGIAPVAGTSAPTGTAPATPSGGGYGY